MAGPGIATGGRAMVNIFDGTRKPYSDSANLLITVRDGNQNVASRKFHGTPSVFFTGLPLFNNFGDNYSFIAAAKGYKDAGFTPVRLAANVDQIVDLMLIPKRNTLSITSWNALEKSHLEFRKLLASGAASADEAAKRYGGIMEDRGGDILACLLNITTALRQIHLPQRAPLDYFTRIVWDRKGKFAMARDRFFAWADPNLIHQLEQATTQPQPIFENAPFILHNGATQSYKQIQFGEANVQLTFHGNDRQEIGGVNCVLVESDMDYFKDSAAHLLLEVAVNSLGNVTDPRAVYALRWIAGRRAGVPEFDPLYTIQKS